MQKAIAVDQDMNAFMAPVVYPMTSKIGLARKFSHLHVKVKLAVRILTVILAYNAPNRPMAVIKSVHLQLHLHNKDNHATRTPDVTGDCVAFSTVTMAVEISVSRFLMNMIQI